METKNIAVLAAKIAEIYSEVGALSKDGYNAFSRYNFISYEQMYATLRPLMAKHGIICLYSSDSVEERDTDDKKIRTIVKGRLIFVCAETGATLEVGTVGGDIDNMGKSTGKAITEAHKRALGKCFLVSSKDDVDPDSISTQDSDHKTQKRVADAMPPDYRDTLIQSLKEADSLAFLISIKYLKKGQAVDNLTDDKLSEIDKKKESFFAQVKLYNEKQAMSKESTHE